MVYFLTPDFPSPELEANPMIQMPHLGTQNTSTEKNWCYTKKESLSSDTQAYKTLTDPSTILVNSIFNHASPQNLEYYPGSFKK